MKEDEGKGEFEVYRKKPGLDECLVSKSVKPVRWDTLNYNNNKLYLHSLQTAIQRQAESINYMTVGTNSKN